MVEEVQVNAESQLIILNDHQGSFEFPIVWLRDNCQCTKCFDSQTYTRTIDWDSFDFDVQPKCVQVSYLSYVSALLITNLVNSLKMKF